MCFNNVLEKSFTLLFLHETNMWGKRGNKKRLLLPRIYMYTYFEKKSTSKEREHIHRCLTIKTVKKCEVIDLYY